MNLKQKELVKDRALALFPVVRNELNNSYELDQSMENCFKYLYLIIYSPKRYLQEFVNSDLKIQISGVRDVFYDYAEHIRGGYGLQDFEVAIIQQHNNEVDAYLRKQNVVIPYRNSFIGLIR